MMDTVRRTLAEGILRRSPLQMFARFLARRGLSVLAYHAVTDGAAFSRQLDYLANHYHPVALQDVAATLDGGGSLPERSVLVTFDDGDRSVLDVAAPMLRERGIPGVAFVVSGSVGSEQPFWWEEVAALVAAGGKSTTVSAPDGASLLHALKRVPDPTRVAALSELRTSADGGSSLRRPQLRVREVPMLEANGIEIGNHTVTHACLPRCDADKVECEIRDAHERLTRLLGHPPRAFAYPNGDWDVRAEPVLRELGYELAFLFDHRVASIKRQDPLRLSRVRVDASASVDRFAILVSGLHPSIHSLRGLA